MDLWANRVITVGVGDWNEMRNALSFPSPYEGDIDVEEWLRFIRLISSPKGLSNANRDRKAIPIDGSSQEWKTQR